MVQLGVGLERDVAALQQARAPQAIVLHRHLVVALGLQHQQRLCEAGSRLHGTIGHDVGPIRAGSIEREGDGVAEGGRAQTLHILHPALQVGHLLTALRRGSEALQVGDLLQQEVFQRAGGSGQQDEAGQTGVPSSDARRQPSALAMPQHVDAVRSHPGQGAGQRRCGHGIVHGLHVEVELTAFGHTAGAIDIGTLVVAQGGDAPCGESPRQVAEGTVGADGLVPVVRAGAMHQHHAGHPPPLLHRAAGQGERGGQAERAAHDGRVRLHHRQAIGRGGRSRDRLRRRLHKEARDAPVSIERRLEAEGVFLERQVAVADGQPPGFDLVPLARGLQGAELCHQLVERRAQGIGGQGGLHLVAQHRAEAVALSRGEVEVGTLGQRQAVGLLGAETEGEQAKAEGKHQASHRGING